MSFTRSPVKITTSAPTCPRCSKAVYAAEQVVAPGGPYHKLCLRCLECAKSLDSTTMTEREGKIYCKACYGKAFGPKGIGFGGAMSSTEGSSPVRSPVASVSTLNTERERPVSPGKGSPAAMSPGSANGGCPTCGKQVYFAEQVLGPGGVKYHRACFRCTSCSRTLDSSSVTESKLGVMCKVCYAREFGPKGYGYAGGRAGVLSS